MIVIINGKKNKLLLILYIIEGLLLFCSIIFIVFIFV